MARPIAWTPDVIFSLFGAYVDGAFGTVLGASIAIMIGAVIAWWQLRVARQRASQARGVTFGEDVTVYVADSPRDVEAARMGGATSVAVASGRASSGELREAGAELVLPDLTDLSGLLALLSDRS